MMFLRAISYAIWVIFALNSCTRNHNGMPGFAEIHSRGLGLISLKPLMVHKWSFYEESTRLLKAIATKKIEKYRPFARSSDFTFFTKFKVLI